jgi:hypothetical protein
VWQHIDVQELKIHWTFLVNIPSPHLLGSHFTRQYNTCILSKISTFFLFSTALGEVKCIVSGCTAFLHISMLFLCILCYGCCILRCTRKSLSIKPNSIDGKIHLITKIMSIQKSLTERVSQTEEVKRDMSCSSSNVNYENCP